MPTQEQITSYLDQLQSIVRDHGWAVQMVFPVDDPTTDDIAYPFAYTVGLAAKGLPELLMIGDSFDWQGAVLDHLAVIATTDSHLYVPPGTSKPEVVTGYTHFTHGMCVRAELWKGDMRIRGPVDDVAGDCPMHMARNYYAFSGQADPETITVLQVEWPDPDGRYVDDGGVELQCSPQLPLVKPLP